ncbi:MAG: hypothetical protein FJ197_01055 [Gammaproteobacteria bacterium]|nr:hypothetical protein [Gammaproteobacteria bacterium]
MITPALRITACFLLGFTALGAAAEDQPVPRHPKAPPPPDQFYTHSGFEGREAELGNAVMEAIRKAGPERGVATQFNAEQQADVGLAVARAIQVISVTEPYQHELNDALVKAQLTALQFAKNNRMIAKYVDHEALTQTPMLLRVGKLMSQGGSPELGIIAITERTACFYQLVLDYQRDGMTMRWKSPYGVVLAAGTPIGQFNMTEQEVHEIFTIPAMQKRAAVMGMELEFSPWQADGWITMTARMAKTVAAAAAR